MWDANLTLRVGVDLVVVVVAVGRVGTAGRRVKGLWDLVVAVLPHGPLVKTARPWLYRPTGGQEGPTRARDRLEKAPAGTEEGDQLVELGGTGQDWHLFIHSQDPRYKFDSAPHPNSDPN